MERFVIRKYQPEDLENVVSMDGRPSKRRKDQLKKVECLEAFYAFIVEQSGKIMGFIIMEDLGDNVSHYMLQINVAKKRSGIGKQLVRKVFTEIGVGGHVSLCVNTDNESAIKFYESLGFKKSGFTEGYRKNQNKYWYQIDL